MDSLKDIERHSYSVPFDCMFLQLGLNGSHKPEKQWRSNPKLRIHITVSKVALANRASVMSSVVWKNLASMDMNTVRRGTAKLCSFQGLAIWALRYLSARIRTKISQLRLVEVLWGVR